MNESEGGVYLHAALLLL